MATASELRHILMKILPAPEMVEQGNAFRISNHLEMVTDSLWILNSFLMDGACRALEQPDVAEWMKDVGVAIEDVHSLLKRILDYWEPSEEKEAEKKRKMSNFFHPSSNNNIRSTSSRRVILVELKETACLLNYLVNRGTAFGLWVETMDSMDPTHDDYSAILNEEVMESQEIFVIEFLQDQRPRRYLWYSNVLIIRGNEYSGKTTLARKVYHHPWVRQNFRRRIWLDASSFSDFNSNMIAKEIARILTGKPCTDFNCWPIVDEHLRGERFFLILDNLYLCSASRNKLYELTLTLLHCGAPGSKFILTAYPPYEYEMAWIRFAHYDLRSPPYGAWERLLLKYATLDNPGAQASPVATDMPIQLAKHYSQDHGANFLIPKGMGLMFRQRDMSQWKELTDELYIRHFSLMQLHYWPIERARRFFYELLFGASSNPCYGEDVFDILVAEGTLIYYWLKRNIEFMPSEYGVDLCFFRMKVSGSSKIPPQCRHLYLPVDSKNISKFKKAIEVARVARKLRTFVLHREEKNEGICQIETKALEGMFSSLTSLSTLYMRAIMIQDLPRAVCTLRCLRYLNLAENKIETLPESLCNLCNLSVLNLSSCEKLKELPGSIHKLRKLQILKLSHCLRIQKLPESIIRLVNLNELDVGGCRRLSELPHDLSGMKNLMQLNMTGCASLTRTPSGIRQLINLQSLRGIDAIDGLGNVMLWELEGLTNLESLHIQHLERLGLAASKGVPLPARLLESQLITELVLHWEWPNDVADKETFEPMAQLMERFLLSLVELKVLRIISYMSKKLPTWLTTRGLMVLDALKRVELFGLRRCPRLPSLGHLPQLEEVAISGFDSVTVIDHRFYGYPDATGFYQLKKLTFSEMPRLEKWDAPSYFKNNPDQFNEEQFGRLEELTLIQCPKLKEFHMRLPKSNRLSLKLWLSNGILMPDSKFDYWSNLGGIDMLQIFGCQELMSLPDGLRMIPNLQTLAIINCNELEALPIWLEQSNLESLYLSSCPALSFIPKGSKVKGRLRNLIVAACPKL